MQRSEDEKALKRIDIHNLRKRRHEQGIHRMEIYVHDAHRQLIKDLVKKLHDKSKKRKLS